VPTGRGVERRAQVDVCHLDGDTGLYHLITISPKAVPAHLQHHNDCLIEDAEGCATERCDPELGCVTVGDDSACDDGIFCNGIEFCDPDSGMCEAIDSCPPVAGCLVSTCDEEDDRCVVTADDTQCDDGLFCTTEHCNEDSGNCVVVSTCPPMIDGCIIRNAFCDEDDQSCGDFADDSLCDDENVCDGQEVCDFESGDCLEGLPLDCDDDIGCNEDGCDPDDGCFSIPECTEDDDCETSLCLIETCNNDGCCDFITACIATTGFCRNFTGGCIEETGECVQEDAPSDTPCNLESGSTFCEGADCDGICLGGECVFRK